MYQDIFSISLSYTCLFIKLNLIILIDVQADVVLAIGTRLGPFGALPQYGFDYWPKDAKIIQVRKINCI